MRYTHDFIIPAATARADPYIDTVYLAIGLLSRVLVRFRAGCHNIVYLTVLDGLQQIIPASPDQSIYGNDTIFDVPMSHFLTMPPFGLTLCGWSPLCLYDHTITLWFDVVEGQTQAYNQLSSLLLHLGETP